MCMSVRKMYISQEIRSPQKCDAISIEPVMPIGF